MYSLVQLCNAVSMIAPLICLWKHRKKRSWYRVIMCFHIPISIAFHSLMAFPLVAPKFVVGTLKTLDFVFIHFMSIASRLDFNKNKRISLSLLLHGFLLFQSTIGKYDPAFLKCVLMFHDNWHLWSFLDPKRVLRLIGISATTVFLYFTDTAWDYGHASFHIMLYWLFDMYFEIYGETHLKL